MQCETYKKYEKRGRRKRKSLVSVSARVGRDVSTFAVVLRHWSESQVLVDVRSVKWCSSAVHAS
eukprot:1428314-Pyramimonas_sp.AAC.1